MKNEKISSLFLSVKSWWCAEVYTWSTIQNSGTEILFYMINTAVDYKPSNDIHQSLRVKSTFLKILDFSQQTGDIELRKLNANNTIIGKKQLPFLYQLCSKWHMLLATSNSCNTPESQVNQLWQQETKLP